MKITESRLRTIIREELDSLPGYASSGASDSFREEQSVLPKGEWVLLSSGDPHREEVKKQLYSMVCDTYAPIGGHVKVCEPGSLDRYKYWVVADLDDDPEIDIGLFGKPDIGGAKMGGVGHDGSAVAKSAYKTKSAEVQNRKPCRFEFSAVSPGPGTQILSRLILVLNRLFIYSQPIPPVYQTGGQRSLSLFVKLINIILSRMFAITIPHVIRFQSLLVSISLLNRKVRAPSHD